MKSQKWFKLLVQMTVNSGDDEKLTSTHLQEIHCQQPFLQVGRARERGLTGLLARGKMEKMTMSMSLRTVRLETEKKGMWRRRRYWNDRGLGRFEGRENQVWEMNPSF